MEQWIGVLPYGNSFASASQYLYQDSLLLASLIQWYIPPGWSMAEVQRTTIPFALPKRPTNWFKLDQQSRQQVLRAYCPNILISACSRDSRPRDWSRLGPIFLVSVSSNIPRDSRDWQILCFLAFFHFFSKMEAEINSLFLMS